MKCSLRSREGFCRDSRGPVAGRALKPGKPSANSGQRTAAFRDGQPGGLLGHFPRLRWAKQIERQRCQLSAVRCQLISVVPRFNSRPAREQLLRLSLNSINS